MCEMEKAVEERGRVVLREEPILAPIVNIDNNWLQNIKNFIWNYFFTICAVYIDL